MILKLSFYQRHWILNWTYSSLDLVFHPNVVFMLFNHQWRSKKVMTFLFGFSEKKDRIKLIAYVPCQIKYSVNLNELNMPKTILDILNTSDNNWITVCFISSTGKTHLDENILNSSRIEHIYCNPWERPC